MVTRLFYDFAPCILPKLDLHSTCYTILLQIRNRNFLLSPTIVHVASMLSLHGQALKRG